MLLGEIFGFIEYENEKGEKISIEKQEEALLRIYQLAGYFNLTKVWNDLNSIENISNLNYVFENLSIIIKDSKANQSNPLDFNATYMCEHFFQNNFMDFDDFIDYILYLSQHAFGRSIGQERYEINSCNWIQNYQDYYIEQARLLRLIDRQIPLLNQYDQCWIAGASRFTLSLRILDFKYHIQSKLIQINHDIFILAGERELWANIDGISAKIKEKLIEISENNFDLNNIDFSSLNENNLEIIEEGKEYLLNLANRFNIKLNFLKPFIEYKTKEECLLGRFPNRIYPNYENENEINKLNETILSKDLIKTYLKSHFNQINIINTLKDQENRPNTLTTVHDAIQKLIQQILSGKFHEQKSFSILLWSNNPSIERQTLITQRKVNEFLEKFHLNEKNYEITIYGIGFSSNKQIEIIHSELGALMTEKYRISMEKRFHLTKNKPKRNINSLLFQTRQKQ